MGRIAFIAAVASFGAAATSSFAGVVLSGTTATHFYNPSSPVSYGSTPNGETITYGDPAAGSVTNTFSLKGKAFSTAGNVPFAVADLSYTNGQTYNAADSLNVLNSLVFTFGTPSGISTTLTSSYQITFTPNIGTAAQNADILAATIPASGSTFFVDGQTYTLKLLGFSNDGGVTTATTLSLPEDATTTSTLYATIVAPITADATPPAVPVPLAAWAGIALLGSLAARHRRAAIA